jgi:hypothetical protein
MDELENVLFYLTDIVYRIVPPFAEELEQAVLKAYAIEIPTRPVLRFGSWVGGDMDGNPNVGADTLRAALARQRDLVLDRYRREATALSGRLSQSGARVGVSDGVRERVAAYSAQFPRTLAAIPARYHDMPYRVLFRLIAARLEVTRRDAAEAYGSAVELERDLGMVMGKPARAPGRARGDVRRAAVSASSRGVRFSSRHHRLCDSIRTCIAPLSRRSSLTATGRAAQEANAPHGCVEFSSRESGPPARRCSGHANARGVQGDRRLSDALRCRCGGSLHHQHGTGSGRHSVGAAARAGGGARHGACGARRRAAVRDRHRPRGGSRRNARPCSPIPIIGRTSPSAACIRW